MQKNPSIVIQRRVENPTSETNTKSPTNSRSFVGLASSSKMTVGKCLPIESPVFLEAVYGRRNCQELPQIMQNTDYTPDHYVAFHATHDDKRRNTCKKRGQKPC
jgi:hypothetical protein